MLFSLSAILWTMFFHPLAIVTFTPLVWLKPSEAIKVIELDLAEEPNFDNYTFLSRQRGAVETRIYGMYPKTFCREVRDGGNILWRPNHPQERFSTLMIRKLYDTNVLAYMHVIMGIRFWYVHFGYNNGKWEEITEEEYERRMERTLEDRRFYVENPESDYVFRVSKYKPYGIPANIYMPTFRYKIKEVWSYDRIVWKAQGNEICTFVALHGNRGAIRLMHMFIKYDSSYKIIFFQWRFGKWQEMDKNGFYKLLNLYDFSEELANRTGRQFR
ncbi:signal peptide containing protein [Theileria equi strain WA]|uniref:Signal peptide containing protein n=1 Tax=Theileria equi strain WA TaxID=1537102 RepID=L1LEE7_THEEQ|nr:signal peptide containing protein [Theileria equi strain WA]EKX73548.1 signal peptide containing protein [Theileria equi strain WA]|eukprot:XP_004833000.1 signal peptide containing protein [Theileria equi strain WA]